MAARQPFRTSGVQGLELKMGILHDAVNGLTSTEGRELFRYFSINYRALVSVRNNGTLLQKTIGQDWKILGHKNEKTPLDEWINNKMQSFRYKLPSWAFVSDLPSLAELDEWLMDGCCETLSGEMVEPDGIGPDGAPSWLLALGMI